jgi:hypothetical protein
VKVVEAVRAMAANLLDDCSAILAQVFHVVFHAGKL